MRNLILVILLVTLFGCSNPFKENEYTLTIDNDIPVQVKFYVDGKITLRIDGESLEELVLKEDTYTFAISSPSFVDCNPYNPLLCTPVYSTYTFETDTTLELNRAMIAKIAISLVDQLTDADIYHVDFKIR